MQSQWRAWAFTLRELGALEGCEQRRRGLTQVLIGTLSGLPLEGQSVEGESWSLGTGAEACTLVQVGDDGLDQVVVEEGEAVGRIRIDFEGIAGSIC